jgi:dTDP-glucose 4,6-dehydratase
MNILVTGGCGFIGSNFINLLLNKKDVNFVVNVDLMTYAGNVKNIEPFLTNRKYIQHIPFDIKDKNIINLAKQYEITHVVNFAAETHVDNSIKSPDSFVQTNVVGTHNLLYTFYEYWKNSKTKNLFLHVSTDEVYGSLNENEPSFSLTTPYKPNSPYSATKAASDHLCRAYYKTYNFPVVITNCCNNYGPNQHFEKLIPLTINKLINKLPIPVYGSGQNIREWIYVEDHCDAIYTVLTNAESGNQYLIGSGLELTNLELVQMLCDLYDEITNKPKGESRKLITFVTDRPGHDFKYSIDSSKIQEDFQWVAKTDFETGLRKTIDWYIKNNLS